MKSWLDIDRFIRKHSLPYEIMGWNMTTHRILVCRWSNQTVANNLSEAIKFMKELQ